MLPKIIVSSPKHLDKPIVTPSQQYDFEHSEWKRKAQLVQFFCYLLLATLVFGIFLYIGLAQLTGQAAMLLGVPVCLLIILVFGFSYSQTRKGNLRLSSQVLVAGFSGLIIFDYALLGAEPALFISLFIPIGLAIALMETWPVVVVTALATVFASSVYLSEFVFRVYTPLVQLTPEARDLCNLICVQTIIPVIVALLVLPARNRLQVIRDQAHYLRQTLLLLEDRQQTSQQVSQQVLKLATQLNGSANQWASGTAQQVEVASQVNSTMSELSGSAASIAQLAEQVSEAALKMAEESQRIEQTTLRSVNQSESGQAAVRSTIQVSSEVAELYQELLNSITELKAKNASTGLILNLLRDIAGQTHLLSLNAAIEAAGAGEYGDRFRKVAHEVKHLATRSRETSYQVTDIVKQIELATEQALNTAEMGKARAARLEMIATQTGQVIEEMRSTVQESQDQASAITLSAAEVREVNLIIKAATNQQRSASEYILDVVGGLNNVAVDSAEGSKVVMGNAVQLTALSEELQLVLAR